MLVNKCLSTLLSAIAVSAVSAQVNAGTKPSSPAPDISKEAYVIEEISTRISAEQDGTGTKETTAKVKMLADAGVKAFAVLSLTYTSANEVVEIDYVRVRKADGTIVKTPDYNIQDMPGEVTRTAPLYSDIHEKHVAVKGLGVGDELEYSVSYRIVKPQVTGHFWSEYSFTKSAIAKDERLEISFPSGKYFKVVSPEFKPEITEANGRRVYRWTHSNLAVKESDPNEIPRRIPPSPDVQVTTFSSWEDVGRWYGDLQKEPLQVTPAIQAKAAELTKGLKTDDEKIRALYNFVSLKYHYIGLDFGIGRYQPHAADDVLDNGYGDCKDKHTLLAALLKALGIDAWPVLIHAQRLLDPEIPSPAQFNHVITAVPQGNGLLWLDTTPEVAPYGLLLLTLRNKQALVIPSSKAPFLAKTPADPPFPQEQKFITEGKLSDDGVFKGHIQQYYRGDSEVLMRMVFRQVAESQWNETVQQFSYRLNFGGDVSNVKMTPPDDIDKPFELSYDYERKNYGGWESRQIGAPLPPMGLEVPSGTPEKKLKEPLLLGGLGRITYHSRVELPKGYEATAPASCHQSNAFVDYTGETRVANGVMETDRVLVIKKNEVALSEWEEYRKFGKALSDDEYNYIQLTATGAIAGGQPEPTAPDDMFREASEALRIRDFKRAEHLLEELIAKQADYKGAHLALSSALAGQNRVPESLLELKKEEQVSPTDPRAYEVAARMAIFQGKTEDAIDEWRKLVKADPTNRTAVSALGALLVRSEKYSDAQEVLEAAVKNAPDNPDLQFQLGDVDLKLGATEKGVEHLKLAVDHNPHDTMTLNNVAYTLAEGKTELSAAQKYGEEAVEELDLSAESPGSSKDAGLRPTYMYSLVWDTLGWVYFQQGDNARAELFVRAAWLLGAERIVAEHLGEIYEKQGKTQLAARAYESALAVGSEPSLLAPSSPLEARNRLNDEQRIRARYKKLTGKDPSLFETRRLPNGQWSPTPAEELRRSRELKLGNAGNLSGSADFLVSIDSESVQSVDFESGDQILQPLESKLEKAKYPFEFPPNSDATLVVRVTVKCQSDGCVGTPMNPTMSRNPAGHAPQF